MANVRTPNAEECEYMVYSEEYGDYLISFYGDLDYIREIYDPDCIQVIDRRIAVIYKRLDPREGVNVQEAGYSGVPKCFGLLDTSAPEATGALRVRRQPYLGYRGRDVLIGFIDTGIDYRQPVFINADNTTRIVSIWDQTIREGIPPDEQIYGTEYSSEQINEALRSEDPLSIVPSIDENGHGTFLAGIAAGNELSDNSFTGIAPDAGIVVVKLKEAKKNLRDYYYIADGIPCYQENDIIQGIRYLFYVSEIQRKPIIICIGVGTNSGDHNGSLFLGRYIQEYLSLRGIFFSIAAGNEGNRGHHFENTTIIPNGYTEVEIQVAEGEYGFTTELWANYPDIFTVSIISPLGEETGRLPIRSGVCQVTNFILERTRICVNYNSSEAFTGEQVIVIRFRTPATGIWKIRVYKENEFASRFHMWLPMEKFIKKGTIFTSSNPDVTICEPGNSIGGVTSATYNHMTNSIYIHSSRGFTRNGQIKPDITAPGVNVYGPALEQGFTRKTGSSIAAAMTAGAIALLSEWALVEGNNLNMSRVEVKNMLIQGATRMDIVYPDREWGYGMLNIYGAFESLR